MQIFRITKGSTSVILPISIYDSSSTTGAKLAGLVYNTASLTAYYNRSGAAGAAVAITLATATKGTWATGGFVAIDGTNMPGDYELHIPDAALATGANTVLVQLKGAANMVPKNILIELTSVDMQDAVRGGMTALPASGTLAVNPILNATQTGVTIPTVTALTNAPSDSSGVTTLLTRISAALGFTTGYVNVQVKAQDNIDFGALQKTSLNAATPASVVGAVGSVTGAVGSVTADVGITQAGADKVWASAARTLTAFSTALALSVWDVLETAIATASSIGLKLKTNLDAAISSRSTYAGADTAGTTTLLSRIVGTLLTGNHNPQTGDSFARLGAPAGASVSADMAAVKVETAAILLDTGTTLDGKIDTIAVDVAGLDGAAMRGTDSAALASVCTETRLAELDAANLPTDIAARATPAQVNAEVLDVLNVDTFAEPGQGTPTATTTLAAKIGYLYKAWRNRNTQTASQYSLYNDDAITVGQKATFADDATTADRGEIATGL